MEYRKAKPGDEHGIIGLINALALYEKEPDAVINTPQDLARDLFEKELCEAFVAIDEEEIVGFSLYYTSYSTWKGPCIYLEDLYVLDKYRGQGLGKKLFELVVEVAKERNVKRMDWQVLDWNQTAIDFYKRLGATIDEEWYNGRLFFE